MASISPPPPEPPPPPPHPVERSTSRDFVLQDSNGRARSVSDNDRLSGSFVAVVTSPQSGRRELCSSLQLSDDEAREFRRLSRQNSEVDEPPAIEPRDALSERPARVERSSSRDFVLQDGKGRTRTSDNDHLSGSFVAVFSSPSTGRRELRSSCELSLADREALGQLFDGAQDGADIADASASPPSPPRAVDLVAAFEAAAAAGKRVEEEDDAASVESGGESDASSDSSFAEVRLPQWTPWTEELLKPAPKPHTPLSRSRQASLSRSAEAVKLELDPASEAACLGGEEGGDDDETEAHQRFLREYVDVDGDELDSPSSVLLVDGEFQPRKWEKEWAKAMPAGEQLPPSCGATARETEGGSVLDKPTPSTASLLEAAPCWEADWQRVLAMPAK